MNIRINYAASIMEALSIALGLQPRRSDIARRAR
jgi:hypothetical protein